MDVVAEAIIVVVDAGAVEVVGGARVQKGRPCFLSLPLSIVIKLEPMIDPVKILGY